MLRNAWRGWLKFRQRNSTIDHYQRRYPVLVENTKSLKAQYSSVRVCEDVAHSETSERGDFEETLMLNGFYL